MIFVEYRIVNLMHTSLITDYYCIEKFGGTFLAKLNVNRINSEITGNMMEINIGRIK